jgi:hypothetical protein
MLSPRLWRVQGKLPNGPLERVMAIAKRADGTLVVHSAIALEDELMKEIDGFGKVAWLVVPNGFHRLDAPRFKERYPDAKVLAPSSQRKKVAEKLPVDGAYEDFPPDPHVSFQMLRGTKEGEGVMIVKDEDGTSLVFNDAIFNMPHVPGVGGFFLRYVGGSSGGPKVSNLGKLLLVKDKKAFAAHLRELADLPDLRRAVVSHHEVINGDVPAILRSIADSL